MSYLVLSIARTSHPPGSPSKFSTGWEFRLFLLALLIGSPGWAQQAPVPPPSIGTGGVVNGASFRPEITSGGWVSIAGANLSHSTRTWTAADLSDGRLPTALDGVSVTIDGQPAYVYYISPTVVNVQAPVLSRSGPVSVTVNNNGATAAATVQVQPFSPAFFPWYDTANNNRVCAVATRADFSGVGRSGLFPGYPTSPAKPDEVVILWGTGFGPADPQVPAGLQVPFDRTYQLAHPVSVSIGGLPAPVLATALSPGSAGLYQLVVRVPPTAPGGDLAVKATIGGYTSPDGVFLAVQSSNAGPNVTGTWSGPASDSTGPGGMTLRLTQAGSAVSGTMTATTPGGTVVFNGNLSGTLAGATLTFSIDVPKGGIPVLPSCAVTIRGATTSITTTMLTGTYSGTNSCAGSFTNGQFRLTRQ